MDKRGLTVWRESNPYGASYIDARKQPSGCFPASVRFIVAIANVLGGLSMCMLGMSDPSQFVVAFSLGSVIGLFGLWFFWYLLTH